MALSKAQECSVQANYTSDAAAHVTGSTKLRLSGRTCDVRHRCSVLKEMRQNCMPFVALVGSSRGTAFKFEKISDSFAVLTYHRIKWSFILDILDDFSV
jgi:hypothetical protein